MKNFIICLSFVLLSKTILAQNLKGIVRDESAFTPVANATLTAGGISGHKVTTDSNGKYSLVLVPGLYSLLVEHPDFKSEIRTNILIGTKQHEENFSLRYYTDSLSEITVRPVAETHEITEAKMHQYAAAFYDPARLINSNAAAINTNDQANHFSVRGSSPNFIQWKVEDVEVVNPNHLENAGTINDRPSSNGGGVSMISAQLLSRSPFLLPVYKPIHGNALTGIFNIQLRNGNDEKAEHIAQASFLGLDFSTEGPIKKNRSSYLVNARYSTIGLLSELGVDFGGEKTNYKDLSATLNFKTKHGAIKFFSITGASSTIFKGLADSLTAESEKDFMNISYQSLTSINGLSYITSLGNTMFLKASAAFSLKQTDYKREPVGMGELLNANNEKYETTKSSGLIYIGKRFDELRISAGTYINYFTNSFSFRQDSSMLSSSAFLPFAQPFISADYSLKKFTLTGGMHSLLRIDNNSFTALPNLKLQYASNEKHLFSAAYSQQAQLQNLLFYSTENLGHLKPAEMSILSSSYKYSANIFTGSIEVYQQIFNNLPANASTGFNAINYFNEHIRFPLFSSGTATVSGIDITLQLNYNRYYFIASATFLKSQYPYMNELKTTRYDPGENYFVTTGKEWRLEKQNRFFTTDLRGTYRKGFRQLNPLSTETVPTGFSSELPDYFRCDLRISFRKSKTKSTTIWALDIQNVSGKRNIGFYYYDRFTKKTEAAYQLGLIPVLSYKLFF